MYLKRKIDIMGIVNLTDDSFYAGSRCADVQSAVARITSMVEEGADIIDLGACSTRPGSAPVGPEEEWRRLEPVLSAVRDSFPDLRISIDTYWSSVVKNAYNLIGDFIVNDISSGDEDPEMLATAGALGLTYVAMHRRGSHGEMHRITDYNDIVSEVKDFFIDFSEKAASAGIESWILDPGFGFSKTVEQNWELLGGLDSLKSVSDASGGTPRLLVGVSRKRMIYSLLDISPEEASSATQVAHLAALQAGADILRVHDVARTAQTVRIYNALSCK